MAIKKIFKAHIPSVNYVTQRGRTCIFQEGRYITDIPEEIAELNDVVNSKSNPHIYIDPNESEIDTTLQDRIAEAQRKATLEVLADHNAKKDGSATGSGQAKGTQNASQVPGAMSPAALLNITSSAKLTQMAAASNQK